MCQQSVFKALSKLLGRSIAGWEGLRYLGCVLSSYRVLSGAVLCSRCAGRGMPLSPGCTTRSLRRFLSTLLLQPFSGFCVLSGCRAKPCCRSLGHFAPSLASCVGSLSLFALLQALCYFRACLCALASSGGGSSGKYGIQSSLVVPPAIHMHRRPPSAQCTSKFAERCSEHLGAACSLCWPSCT